MNATAFAEQDDALLAAVPEWMALGITLKAMPHTAGGKREIWLEASNEDVDLQGEVVLQKALVESQDYYLRHGNVDLSHITVLGAKAGIPNYLDYEIGRPTAVRVDGRKTFVKAELYSGDSAMAKNADTVWNSLTRQTPPARWYASVAGPILAKSLRIDPVTHERVPVIERVRWNNIALDRMPVNRTVGEISTRPIGVFAKSFGAFVLAKSEGAAAPAPVLTAGYGTDSATLSGGAALRKQSADPAVHSYFDFRDRIAGAIRRKACGQSAAAMTEYAASQWGVARAEAADWSGRFIADLRAALNKGK